MEARSPSQSGIPRQDPLGKKILRWLVHQLGRARVAVEVFLVTGEGAASDAPKIEVDSRFKGGFAGPEDIEELVRVEPGTDAAMCAERLRRGLLCYAVKDGDRIVAKMWCDLEECNDRAYFRRLASREVYLFSAYTDPALRGHNLAPFMRQQCCAALKAMGRDAIFSCTDYFNTAARRFKQKLGAVDELLCVSVTLFGRFSRTFVLRRYTDRLTVGRDQ
jgi:GNAT superfamily N-acetyltransferase